MNTTVVCPSLTGKCFLQGYYLNAGFMKNVLYLTGKESNPNSTNVDYITVELHAAFMPHQTLYNTKTL